MPLLRGKLLAGALFAGALFGPQGEVVATPVAAEQHAGLFRPIRAVFTHEVSLHAVARWNTKFPDAVVRLVIPASSWCVDAAHAVPRSTVLDPNTGLVTDAVCKLAVSRWEVLQPAAGSNSEFLRAAVFCGGSTSAPSCGAVTPDLCGVATVSGLVAFPTTVKNPTPEQLNALFDL